MCVTIGLNENLLNNQISTTMEKEKTVKRFYFKLVLWELVKYSAIFFLPFAVLAAIVYLLSDYVIDPFPFWSITPCFLLIVCCLYYPIFLQFKERIREIKNNLFCIIKARIKVKMTKYEKKKASHFEYALQILFSKPEETWLSIENMEEAERYGAKISKCQDLISYIEIERALSPRSYSVVV